MVKGRMFILGPVMGMEAKAQREGEKETGREEKEGGTERGTETQKGGGERDREIIGERDSGFEGEGRELAPGTVGKGAAEMGPDSARLVVWGDCPAVP